METLTIAARNDLVARISDLRERIEELEWGRSEDDAVLGLRTELSQAYESYAAGLPRLALSRCPFTGAVLTTAIDTWGLDGPWWDAERPVRPMEDTPSRLLVLSGAMRLVDPIEPADFLTLPGPQVPSVAPSLLERPGVSAVLGSLPVGRHTAYSIAYFADPPDDEPPPLNTWGTRSWQPPWNDLAAQIEVIEEELELDADLAPWIERGKLLWIAPGDTGLSLHSTISGCPFLALDGVSAPSRIRNGEILKVES